VSRRVPPRAWLRRARRPLIALIALVLAVVVGYVVKGLDSGDSSPRPASSTSSR
jgi:hypothetical protein